MKTKINRRQKTLTLGEFIASVYDGHGKYRARGLVRLALKAHLVEFRDPHGSMVS